MIYIKSGRNDYSILKGIFPLAHCSEAKPIGVSAATHFKVIYLGPDKVNKDFQGLPWDKKTRSIIQVDLSMVKHCKGFFMIFVNLINSLSASGGLGIQGLSPNFKAAVNSKLVDWVVYCSKIHRFKPIVIVNLFVDEDIKIVDDIILSLVSHLLVFVFVCKRS